MESFEDAEAFDVSAFLTELDDQMALAGDDATIEEVWTGLDVEATLSSFDSDREVADKIKARHLARIVLPVERPSDMPDSVRVYGAG